MGLLDKVKAFTGGKNMAKVTIPVIERQPSEIATFPVTDTVLKGRMVIEALQPCTLLATKYEVWLHISADPADEQGSPHLVVMGKDPDANTSYSDDDLKFPAEMQAGQTIEQPFIVTEVDLAKVLDKNGFSEPQQAIGDGRVKLVVKCIADVKGSPFDPSAEVTVALVA
jgi:hypothetical protein